MRSYCKYSRYLGLSTQPGREGAVRGLQGVVERAQDLDDGVLRPGRGGHLGLVREDQLQGLGLLILV